MTQPIQARPVAAVQKAPTSVAAILGFVLSLTCFGSPLALMALGFGIGGVVSTKRHPEIRGRGFAIAAVVIASIGSLLFALLLWSALVNFAVFQKREKQMEAKHGLARLSYEEGQYWRHHDLTPGADLGTIGFVPDRGNYVTYFLAPSGVTDRRDRTPDDRPAHPVIIDADRQYHPDVVPPPDLAATHCPVTRKRADGLPDLRVGVQGDLLRAVFLAVAAVNVDDDPMYDCWSISNADRRSAGGKLIPAGHPYHELDDLYPPKAPPRAAQPTRRASTR